MLDFKAPTSPRMNKTKIEIDPPATPHEIPKDFKIDIPQPSEMQEILKSAQKKYLQKLLAEKTFDEYFFSENTPINASNILDGVNPNIKFDDSDLSPAETLDGVNYNVNANADYLA